MVDLARMIGVSRQAISSFEKGEKYPAYETMREMIRVLDVNDTYFFLRSNESNLKNESAINFRTLRSTNSRELDQSKVYLDWFSEICYLLAADYVEFQSLNFPRFDIDDFENLTEDDIDDYAEKTRRFFGLGDGPISNLTLLLENHGIFVGYLPLPQKVDGISVWINKRPYILINRSAYSCRARFDLAHELGHLVLHQSLAQEDLDKKEILDIVEKQANHFAGSFLVPEKAIAKEFYSIDLNAIKDLKKRWGVSMQALIMILFRIELISESQKKYFFQKISSMGFRKKEPLDDIIKKEESITIKRIIELLNSKKILLANELLSKLSFPILKELSGLQDDFFIEKEIERNVIKFKLNT